MSTRRWIVVGIAALGLPLSSALRADSDVAESIDSLVSQWVSIERQRSALNANWKTRKLMLEQQLVLLGKEEKALQSVLQNSSETMDEVESRRFELLELQNRAEQDQVLVGQSLDQAEQMLGSIFHRLPPPPGCKLARATGQLRTRGHQQQ